MQLRNLDKSSDATGWDSKWTSIFDQYQRDLRHAYYIRSLLKKDEHKVLELGAGSFRDMAALRRMHIDCYGMDFSAESAARAKQAFPEHANRIKQMSAFEMSYPDKFFDVSYHNGFWVLFSDDQIDELAREQARVTRKRMMATVHNGHNRQFVEYFDRMKHTDPLYDIRFFQADELAALMGKVCDEVVVIPVGKGARRHEDWLIKMGITHPAIIRSYLKLSGQSLIESSERLLCIGTPR